MDESREELLRKRREIASHVAAELRSLPQMDCIYVFGSVATGYVDAQSDVDLTCVTQGSIPRAELRCSILSSLGDGWTIQDDALDNPIWAACDSDGRVDDVLVTVHYQTTSFIDNLINQVVRDGAIRTEEIPFRPYTLIGMLRQSWLLEDRYGHFQKWLDQTATYPKRLQANVIANFAPVLRDNVAELISTAERGLGPSVFLFFLTRASDAMSSILYAINEHYDPADRRAEETILPVLTNVPTSFRARWVDVLTGPFDGTGMIERAHAFEAIASEVLELAPHEQI